MREQIKKKLNLKYRPIEYLLPILLLLAVSLILSCLCWKLTGEGSILGQTLYLFLSGLFLIGIYDALEKI